MMPQPEGNIIQFSKPHYQHLLPFILYADIKYILVPISAAEPSSGIAFSNRINDHQASGYASVVLGIEDKCYKKLNAIEGKTQWIIF